MSNWILIGPVVGVILLTTALLVGYVAMPPIIVQRITESVEIVKGTAQYDRWVELPQALDFKVYIFNVTNVDEIQKGGQPKVEEVGPYVYSQYRKKFNIRFSRDKERASYFSQMTFQFNAEKSGLLKEDDKLTVLNMHMNSILQSVEAETPIFLPVVNDQLEGIFGPTKSFFINTTPKELLFEGIEFCKNAVGIPQVICQQVEERQSPSITRTEDGTALKFSMFGFKNTTHDGHYEINTGIRNLQKVMKIERWNNARALKQWKTDKNGAPSTCQFINGTDGSGVPPFREEGSNFYIFTSDICRSVQMFYAERSSYQGIPAHRYTINNNFLNDMPDCFCVNLIKDALTDDRGCLYPGAIDLTQCFDAPIVGTLPHFLNADEKYNLMVDGLNPVDEKHNIYLDVEPRTGAPLFGGKRLQFNMFLKKIDRITLTDNFKTPRLFPVLWVEESIELNDELVGMIKGDLINVLRLIDILMWTFVGIGAALIVGMLIWFFIARSRRVTKTVSVDPIVKE